MSAPTGETDSLQSKSRQLLESCWSCRLISGAGLMLSGAYVFNAARKIMRTGVLMTPGLVAQITFAGCLTAWGMVVIANPVKNSQDAFKSV
uniref:Distal membrane-arm assembly complex protein 1-like domain-containing protein n=1 Tax=Anabas testudineus TaxID=64144 RepID=A0AAQ6IU72_ANATE